MGRVKKKPVLALLCIVLSILTMVAMMPGMAYADENTAGSSDTAASTQVENQTGDSTDPNTSTSDPSGSSTDNTTSQKWDHSKSKTATNLDNNYTSEVTLSLPSKEEQLTTEVCFVIDKSSFADTQGPALRLLGELKDAVNNSGAKVQVDIVEFNRTAHYHGSYNLAKQYDEIVDAFKQQNSGGTNMHAGLLLAQEVLARNSSISNSRKYMVLVSDGDSYLYCKNGDYNKAYSRSYISVESARGSAYGGYYDEGWYCPSNGYEDTASGKKNVKRPTTSSQSDWEKYLNDVRSRNQESNGDEYDFEWKYYDNLWDLKTPDEVTNEGFGTQPAVPRSASNLDMGFLNAASVYHDLAANYHCYAMAAPSWNTADGGHSAFMNYLNNGAVTDFESIKNEILYYLGAGSTVKDYIGYTKDYNFDLKDPDDMVITIDGNESETYKAVKLGENQYGFGPELDNGQYSYEVTYTPGEKTDGEHIVWTINTNVTNFQRVNLTYKVQLMNPKTAPGTYGEYDKDGSQKKSGLYTNSRAVLHPVASDKTQGASEEFLKPTVSYTIENPTPIVPEEHTITFQPNNGQPTFTQTVPDGGKAVVPDQPVRKGYTFEGWYTDSALTKAYDFNTPVTSSFTLYAKWTPEKVTPTPEPKPVKPAKKKVTGILLPKVIAKGKHTQMLTWTALKNVDGYFIYTNHCDEGKKLHPFKKVADYKASKARVYTRKNLKTYHNYKYYVAAYKIKNGKKVVVRNSVTVHSVCGNTSARSTNVKSVKVKKHAVTLKKGKTYKVKATISRVNKKRAFLDATHCGLLRYLTADSKIADVNYNTGVIKAKKAGKTTVYVLGVNGIRDKVTVTVK
jgi:uncharacterized repeat protein (TIGR02543 family)